MNRMYPLVRPALTALALAALTTFAHADQTESIEAARQTTLSLIEVLVKSGVLTQDKADAILKEAEQRARQVVADKARAGADAVAKAPAEVSAAKNVQRVPYVSEAMRAQLRNEVKEEVLATARQERWGVPNAPSWMDRIRIEGDVRYRYQKDSPDHDNTSADTYVSTLINGAGGISRAPDFGQYKSVSFDSSKFALSTANTQDARSRERLRARLSVSAKVSDEVGVGFRLATGSATDRVSTNQTLGQDFNKYQVFLDRAYMRVDPAEWLTVQAGRIPNPWFSTEMTWSENLNFEGVAATSRLSLADGKLVPFATVGWFPLREDKPGERQGRALIGAQLGAQLEAGSRTKLKFGLAYYRYQKLEGREDTNYFTESTGGSVPDPLTYGQYEYGTSMRQKGNTLFQTNPADLVPVWGLAYRFEPIVLTASAEFLHFSPYSVLLAFEYAKNTAFSAGDFQSRAGSAFTGIDPGGRDDGYLLKAAFGAPEVREPGDWQLSASYRHVGSDAVLDAFTDSDLGLGGTNVEGFTLGLSYGLYRNTSVSVRYLAGRSIDSTINSLTCGSSATNADSVCKAKFKVNTLQVDLNVRF
jgi:hypothetical protein